MGIKTEDTITKEPKKAKKKFKEQSYKEGECENCGNYGQLYDVEGVLLCEECKDEEGKTNEEDAEED